MAFVIVIVLYAAVVVASAVLLRFRFEARAHPIVPLPPLHTTTAAAAATATATEATIGFWRTDAKSRFVRFPFSFELRASASSSSSSSRILFSYKSARIFVARIVRCVTSKREGCYYRTFFSEFDIHTKNLQYTPLVVLVFSRFRLRFFLFHFFFRWLRTAKEARLTKTRFERNNFLLA